MKRLPSLNALKVFRSVAESGGVSKAAARLNVSQSAVSRFVSLLESELGVELFQRREGFALTPAGQTLYEHVSRSFQILEEGILRMGEEHSSLSIKTTPTFALRWLLHQRDIPPGISIAPRWKGISITENDFDAGIRWGIGDWPRRNAVCLYEEMLLPVCSPQYLRQHGPFRSVADLSQADLLHSDPDHRDWQAWVTRWSGGAFAVRRGLAFDTLDNALQGALAHHGVAMADPFLARRELISGELVAAVPEVHPSGESYYLVYRSKIADDRRLKHFAEWLTGALTLAMQEEP
jgi:LysR family glycine cleavage system transcriptional activator